MLATWMLSIAVPTAAHHSDYWGFQKSLWHTRWASYYKHCLTHWGWMMHICVSKLTIISSDNGLAPCRGQAIIWANAGILLINPLGTNFSEILIKKSCIFIKENAFKNAVWKMLAILYPPQCVITLKPRQDASHFAEICSQGSNYESKLVWLFHVSHLNSLYSCPSPSLLGLPGVIVPQQMGFWLDTA